MRTLFLFFACAMTFAQETGNITGKYYVTNVDLVVTEYNIVNKTAINTSKYIAKSDTKFTAYELLNDKLLVKFWNFTAKGKQQEPVKASPETAGIGVNYISMNTNDRYFLMDLEEFNQKTSPYNGSSHSFVWGFSTTPIKMRLGSSSTDFKYSTGFSLGMNAGYEYGFKSRVKQSLGWVFGIGISSVAVEPAEVGYLLDSPSTLGAITPSLGMVYSYESFQAGIFTGIDYLQGDMGRNWMYKNRPWLGLGLGFTIFQKNKADVARSQDQ